MDYSPLPIDAALPDLKGHALEVTGLHLLRNGQTLVSTSADATVRRWACKVDA